MTLKSLRVVGPFYGPSGYENHVRECVRALVRAGVEVQLLDLPGWESVMLPPGMFDPWFDSLSEDVGARVALHFCTPIHVIPQAGFINVNYTMFEANRICDAWVEANRQHDLVIVPTESSRAAWIDSGVEKEKIRVCPEGVDPVRFSGTAEPLPLGTERDVPLAQFRTRFLNISEIVTRKNLEGLVRVWLRATTRDDDAVLILKLGNYAYWDFEHFQEQVAEVEETLGMTLDDAAPIHILHDLFSDEEMPRLYASATHYLSMSFGEGWDLPMVEAGASGLTLVAPRHSAYLTYLDDSIAHLIPTHEVPALFPEGSGMGELFQNASWWMPDEDAAVEIVRSIIAGTAPPKRSPRDRLASDFTWDRSAERLIEILDEAQSPPRRRWFWNKASTR